MGSTSPTRRATTPTVRAELAAHGAGLDALPEIVVLSKSDLVPRERAHELVGAFRGGVGDGVAVVLAASAATGEGIEELVRAVFRVAAREPEQVREAPAFEAEHMTYRPAGDQGFDVVREGEAFRVRGRGIEMLVARHDLSNHEALAYLEARLREIGVIGALERAGFEPGDDVRIGEEEFELDPG